MVEYKGMNKEMEKLHLTYFKTEDGNNFLELIVNLKVAEAMIKELNYVEMAEQLGKDLSLVTKGPNDVERGLAILRKYVHYENVITYRPKLQRKEVK